jgi:hypothetical protein
MILAVNGVYAGIHILIAWVIRRRYPQFVGRRYGFILYMIKKAIFLTFGPSFSFLRNIDKKFDAALQEECAGGKCVVATWLGPWMAPGRPFRVWLDVPQEVRAQRLARRDGITPEAASAHIQKRDADNRGRYKKVYGIDIFEHAGFDLVLDAPAGTPELLAEKIVQAYNKRLI